MPYDIGQPSTQQDSASKALVQLGQLKVTIMSFTDREAALKTIQDLQNAEMKIIASMLEPTEVVNPDKRR